MTRAPVLPTRPPSLRLLLAAPATDLWSTVLTAVGGRLRTLRPTSVTLQPDGAATVQYSAVVAWPGERETREALAATTGSRIPAGAAVVEGEIDGASVRVGLWRWPLDPALPALGWAASAAAVGERLGALGLLEQRPRLRLRSYRPGRRAVVEVVAPGRRLFLKVVRPAAVDRLAARHAALAGALPAPPVLAALPDGAVVLPALPGTPLRDLLGADGPGAGLPGWDRLDALLDGLPALPAADRRPGDGLARAAGYATVLGAVAGGLRGRLDALTGRLAAVEPGAHPLVPVHGDFYEAQLLVSGGAVTGLLDVDTAGAGHRVDDWATLLAHLALLEHVLPRPATAAAYRRELEAAALRRWPGGQLHPRVAAVLLGLATGPFRVQQEGWPAATEARLRLAEAEAARA
ncbi:phosphotransferase [Geodermatophilus sp. SYSU D00815]